MKHKFSLLFVFAAIIFSACEKDTSEETGQIPNEIIITATTNTCKDCIYIPVCSGSVYSYKDSVFYPTDSVINTNFTLSYIKDTSINSAMYKKFTGEAASTFYTNCTAGVSKINTYNGQLPIGIPTDIVEAKLTPLKANEIVGATWNDSVTIAAGQTAPISYVLNAKGITKTVAGITYTDVNKVTSLTAINVTGVGKVQVQIENYYARGKGLIESFTNANFMGLSIPVSHRVLINAVIP